MRACANPNAAPHVPRLAAWLLVLRLNLHDFVELQKLYLSSAKATVRDGTKEWFIDFDTFF